MLGIRSGLRLRKAENKLLHARVSSRAHTPSIFTVKLDNQSEFFTSEQRVSYSYTDVLTKSVELVIYTPEEECSEKSVDETSVVAELEDIV